MQRLVELHGGTVEARATGLGRGSEFVVRLPARARRRGSGAAADRARPRAADAGAGRRILVVDDNRTPPTACELLLRLLGHQATIAHDGAGALTEVATLPPEVVLLDIGLPGMDGYEVARELRASPEGASLVIAAVTGYGTTEDHQRSEAAGFDYHFVKPIDFERLRTILSA